MPKDYELKRMNLNIPTHVMDKFLECAKSQGLNKTAMITVMINQFHAQMKATEMVELANRSNS